VIEREVEEINLIKHKIYTHERYKGKIPLSNQCTLKKMKDMKQVLSGDGTSGRGRAKGEGEGG
jgi:hypothetical protein